MSIQVKVERRWTITIEGEGHPTDAIIFNSIDGCPSMAKISVNGTSRIVPISDLIDALKQVAANTTGIPSNLADDDNRGPFD